jgi:arylformamidase
MGGSARKESMKRLFDLSHVIEDGMITYKGLPAPVICDYLSRENSRSFYEAGTEFQIGRIDMVANTGTYIDCPFHRYADGQDLSEVELSRFANLDAVVVKVDHRITHEITPMHFEGVQLEGKALLIKTGWSEYWRTDKYFENHPYVSADAARYLAEQKVRLVGIDSHNIDDTRTKSRPAHSILLKDGILIVEHLCNLDTLPTGRLLFNAVPPKFKGVGTFPVRAYAVAD